MSQKTKKLIISLLIGVALLFLIVPVSAFVNGDFETGLMTPWGGVGGTFSGGGDHHVHGDYAKTGSYGLLFWGNGNGYYHFKQNGVDFTNKKYLFFDMKINKTNETASIKIMNNWNGQTLFYDGSPSLGGYKSYCVDLTEMGLSGEAEFYVKIAATQGDIEIYLDNFKFSDVSLPGDNCSINYNPDIPITNVKPFNITYRLNDTFEGYWARIYGWHCSEMNNETYCLAHELEAVTWVDNDIKYMTTDNYFHHYDWWEINDSYGIALYNIAGRTIHIPFDEIEDDPNALAWDQIYVNYSWNATPPPNPTPEPTPDLTPDPTPSGTPTPGPTATPQPEPEPTNESLNTSFKEGYYNLVDGTVDGFFTPVCNFTDYIAQPLTSLNHTLLNFTVEMNKSFNTTSISLGISTNILFLIMSAFPQKIINVMAYYLCWIMILLIFKGQT